MARRMNLRLLLGLGLVVLGGLFLLDNFNVIYFDVPYWVFKWQTILIIIGLLVLANSESNTAGYILIIIGLLGWFPEFWPLLLVGIGAYLLYKRKDSKIEDANEINKKTSQDDFINDTAIFGGGKKMISTDKFRGGKLTAVFGGSEIDLTDCKLAEGTNVLDIFAMFGGTDISAPSEWTIKIDVIPIFGGFEDKRRKDPKEVPDPERKLVIKGLVLFGGGSIKS